MSNLDRIDGTEDVLDSRDVIDRIEYLENLAEDKIIDDSEVQELETLREFADEAPNYIPEWNDGATLVREDYFVTYAQQLAEDLGMVSDNESWPYNCIDWHAAADALQEGYTTVDLFGTVYLVRDV